MERRTSASLRIPPPPPALPRPLPARTRTRKERSSLSKEKKKVEGGPFLSSRRSAWTTFEKKLEKSYSPFTTDEDEPTTGTAARCDKANKSEDHEKKNFSVVSTSSFPNLSKGKKNRSTAHSFHSCFTSFHSFAFFTCFLSSLEGESLLATSLIDCSKHFPRIVKFPLFFPTLHSSFNEDFRR